MTAKIQIKGIREGLLITTAGDGEWEPLRLALLEHLDSQAEFLRGAQITLDIGNHTLRAAELGALRKEFQDRQLSLWGVLSNSPATVKSAQALGLATRLAQPKPQQVAPPAETRLESGEEAILVHRTLRSGFRLQNAGHVVIIGDVNPGAEVIAGGDVVVWGRLLGMVHAGAAGNENAIVCALDLSPTQLRIAGQITTTPKRRGKPQPEMARIEGDQIIAAPWTLRKH